MVWRPSGGEERGTPEVGQSRSTRARRKKARERELAETPTVVAMREAMPRKTTGTRPPAGKYNQPGVPNVTVELGKRWSAIVYAVRNGEYSWQEFCDSLDEEELARGQLRADDGTFVGKPPTFVPREFLLAAQREQKRRFETLFSERILRMAEQYLDMAEDKDLKPEVRAKMLQYAMERIMGGIPKDIRIAQEQPWEQMVVNVHADEGDMPEHLKRRYAGYTEREGSDSGTD